MKKRSEKQEDLDKLKSQLATVSTVILSTFQGITVEDDNKLRRAVEQAGGHYQVVKNTLAERAASGTPDRAPAEKPDGNQFHRLHGHRSGFARQGAHQNREGRSGLPVPRRDRRRARAFDRGNPAAFVAALEGRIDQQDHVSGQRAGAAHRLRAGRGQPQPGRHGQRSGEGQQVRTGFGAGPGRNGSIKNLICI